MLLRDGENVSVVNCSISRCVVSKHVLSFAYVVSDVCIHNGMYNLQLN